MKSFQIILLSFFLIVELKVYPNNVQISNIEVRNDNELRFDFSWENAWNFSDSIPPFNHDALWIFIKAQHSDGGWEHLKINTRERAEISSEFNINYSTDGIGLFVSLAGIQSMERAAGQIQIEVTERDLIKYTEISVHTIEMVYVPESSFYVGDDTSNFTLGDGLNNEPFLIETSAEIAIGQQSDELWSRGEEHRLTKNIPKEYPNGFDAFYCMKYEISQEQYVDFLNTLPYAAQQNRKPNLSSSSICTTNPPYVIERNGIVLIEERLTEYNDVYGNNYNLDENINAENDGQNIACNFLTWSDITAYLDWSGLRPMTELEYEKACRGPRSSVALEFAWGSSEVQNAVTIENRGLENERVEETVGADQGLANHGYCAPSGPLRCGFGGSDTSTIYKSGSSYYGIMELSGNLWESVVSLSNIGLQFQGEHGDGKLTMNGFSDLVNWRPEDGKAAGVRGGAWNSGVIPGFRDLAVSDRFFAFLNTNALIKGTIGGRGVRTFDE